MKLMITKFCDISSHNFGIILIDCVTDKRNPFTRLYSAWNDKSRTHRFQNGSILPEGEGFNTTFRPFCVTAQSFEFFISS